MPESDTFSVAVAQRRLLEAISNYGSGTEDPAARGWSQYGLGQEFFVAAQVAADEDQTNKASVLLAITELVNAVGQEQLEREVAG